eukprot:GHRR01031474.1.p1 GENE.GHRR01031474.1~~GHRR01031474.1.p1  ORF type:complete len:161 (-),score=24.68 GHRR01031474.1:160-642(-)
MRQLGLWFWCQIFLLMLAVQVRYVSQGAPPRFEQRALFQDLRSHHCSTMALSMKSSLVATTSKATRSAVRSSVVVRAASRPTWYPGATPPRHLDGSYLGDYGFDPLRLGVTPSNLSWFREAELTNGRWAMAAVAGILFTDLVGLPKFWLAGNEVSRKLQQ